MSGSIFAFKNVFMWFASCWFFFNAKIILRRKRSRAEWPDCWRFPWWSWQAVFYCCCLFVLVCSFFFVYNWPNYSCVLFSVMQDVTTNTERGRRIGQAVASTGKAVGKSVSFLWLLNRSQGSKVLEILQCSILSCSVKRWFRVCAEMFLFLSIVSKVNS